MTAENRRFLLPPIINRILTLLTEQGFAAYVVGGAVRDLLLGKIPGDFDVATSARPESVISILEPAGFTVVGELGQNFGVVVVHRDAQTVEIATFRGEAYGGDAHKPEQVWYCDDLEADLSRRDFTVNAMAYHPASGLVDPFGGQADMKAKCLRCVGEPHLRFTEDALRILRALRFAAVLGFTLEEETAKAAFELKERLNLVSAERIYVELKKLLLGDWAFDVLVEYKEIIGVVVPELVPAFDCPQQNPWHVYDVFTHIARSVEAAPKDADLRLVMLFHDIGKPACKTTDEEGIDHFYGHPTVSEQLAKAALERLKASRASMQRILPLIRYHDGHILTDEKSIKRWLNRLGQAGTLDLIDVKTADLAAQNLARTQPEIEELYRTKALLRQILERGDAFALRDLAIGGEELLALGYRGKAIGGALDALLSGVIAGEAENDRVALLQYLAALNLPKSE